MAQPSAVELAAEREKQRQARRRYLQQRQTVIFGWVLVAMIVAVVVSLPFATGLISLPFAKEFTLSASQKSAYPPCVPSGDPVSLKGVKVEVLNGSSHSGLAKDTATALGQLKVDVTNVGNSNDAFVGSVRISTSEGKVAQAYSLARLFPNATVRLGREETEPIKVVLGEQFEGLHLGREGNADGPGLDEKKLGPYPTGPEECQ